MLKVLTFGLLMFVVLGVPILAGGGADTLANGAGMFETAAFATVTDEMDVLPCLFWTRSVEPVADNAYVVFYDQDTNSFQTPRLIAADMAAGQWTPQRNGIGWDTDGKYNLSFVEVTTADLEIWISPDDKYQDDV